MTRRLREDSQTAAAYFTDPGFRRVLEKTFKRYASLGRMGGNAVIERATAEECEAVNRFFGWDYKAEEKIEVPLLDFDAELRNSRFDIGLLELHEQLYGTPLLTNQERKQATDSQWRRMFQAVFEGIESNAPPIVLEWMASLMRGEGAGARTLRELYRGSREAAGEALTVAAGALSIVFADASDGLAPPMRLPVLAAKVSGDAHALDPKQPAGRLFIACLRERASGAMAAPEEERGEEDAAATLRRRELYRTFGVLDDDVSSTVCFYASHDAAVPMPSVWTLRQVETESAFPRCSAIYAVENPAVFSTILDALQDGVERKECLALVCTSGQASAAVIRWIRRCIESASGERCPLYYSGDFDVKGLAMGGTLAALFPDQYVPWRFDAGTYQSAIRGLERRGPRMNEEELERLARMSASWEPSLCEWMRIAGRKVHQETFVEALVGDYLCALRGEHPGKGTTSRAFPK